MSIDKQKLQALLWAEVAAWSASSPDWLSNSEALEEFLGKQTLEEVALELLDENERLAAGGQLLVRDRDELRAERDQLKAENGLLRQLAIDTGLELRRASSWICREVEAGTKSATHWAVRLREIADKIDAAVGKAVQP
ncbi:hypothetical protein [Pseudomonas sp. P97.38]|uniref:hypothetical protein n=1 Tax=Pseudomonas sp. P97.38 TaxID=255451 RepID=UPI00069D6C87|nr:hypothetical protein [Pseudomonas sp. P97.38]